MGVGDFWYEPEVWSLPLFRAAKVLYASLCSFLGHGQINRRDLRGTLKGCTDDEIGAECGVRGGAGCTAVCWFPPIRSLVAVPYGAIR